MVATKYLPLPWRVRQPGSLLAALGASLARLQLPAVDLYQIHSPVASFRSVEVRLAGVKRPGLQPGIDAYLKTMMS